MTKKKTTMKYVPDKGFTCTCGKESGPSGWAAAHMTEGAIYTCLKDDGGCGKQWDIRNWRVTER